jgi:hypothetical protein
MMSDIYNKYFLSQYIDAKRKELDMNIEGLEVVSSTDIVGIVQRLIQQSTIKPIEIKDPKT